jgi:5-formyltetrahydrofolate cyclo-ligase
MNKIVGGDKKSVRERLKSFRLSLSEKEVSAKSSQIQKLLFSLPEFQRAKTICFYVAKGNEVQTECMIKESIKQGKHVLVPITDKKSGRLVLSELSDYDAELEPGAFGVLEPKPACRRIVPATQVELIIVPGVAYDLRGHRLGHGKGYYDRFLRGVSSLGTGVLFIGLAYESQVLDKIPCGPSDVVVHKIVTEKRVINAC